MHLVVPFASDDSEACRHVLRDLALPNLARLIARLEPEARDEGTAATFSPPHERALATARGWHGADGTLPFAAHAAAGDGLGAADVAWGLVTPAHWQLGREHATMVDPAQLHLGEAESRALFDTVRDLFESEGFVAAWGAAERWYIGRAELQGFATASLDRVIGRNVDGWLGETRSAMGRLVRRLQSEVQLVFHEHAVNESREARGEAVVNSFWLSGCGRAQASNAVHEAAVNDSLRAPLHAGDWAAWAEAWQAIDGELLAREGEGIATLTLCGERSAERFASAPTGLLHRLRKRWNAAEPHTVLEGL